MRRMATIALAMFFFLELSLAPALSVKAAEDPITVMVDGVAVGFPDQQPYFKDGRVMVPVRAPMEAIGAYVTNYVDEQGVEYVKITRSWDSYAVELWFVVGTSTYLIGHGNDQPEGLQLMDVASEYMNGRVCLPIRYAAENFGYTVGFDEATNTVYLESPYIPPDDSSANPQPEDSTEQPEQPSIYEGTGELSELPATANSGWWQDGMYEGSLKDGVPYGHGKWTIRNFGGWGEVVIVGETESCTSESIYIKNATVYWDSGGTIPTPVMMDVYKAVVENATVYKHELQSSIAGQWTFDSYNQFEGSKYFTEDGTMSDKGVWMDRGDVVFDGESHYRANGLPDTLKGKLYDSSGNPTLGVWKYDQHGDVIDYYPM